MATSINSSGVTFPDATTQTTAASTNGSAKAWVNWTGNSTINAAYNVSSITKGGTGNYTINFTNAFADTAYCETQGTWEYQRGWTGAYTKLAGSFQFEMHNTANGSPIDMSYGNFAFFR